jgi:hypothetical protein
LLAETAVLAVEKLALQFHLPETKKEGPIFSIKQSVRNVVDFYLLKLREYKQIIVMQTQQLAFLQMQMQAVQHRPV